MSDEQEDVDGDWAAEELDPAETLEDLLEEIAEGLQLDVEVEVEASEGLLTGRLTSGCSSAGMARRSTRCSTWRSGSCSRRGRRRCAS
jgi:hypothetical protein